MLLRFLILAVAVLASSLVMGAAYASETDQYMAWGVELEDCSAALNDYLNDEIAVYLARKNAKRHPPEAAEKLVQGLYFYLFNGLHASRIRHFVMTSDEVDRYPDDSVGYSEHLQMSIFGMKSFPFFLPMADTINVGGIYLGIDKIGHFFGFGRRYLKRYLRYREDGMGEEEAMEKTVLHGFLVERYFVGNLIDGIFSYGDLEANFQGMMMARALSEGDDAPFQRIDGKWVLTRPVDILEFITADFDESYNNSHYSGLRKGQVHEVLRRDVCPKRVLPSVQARFAYYGNWEPSFSEQVLDGFYAERKRNPRERQALAVICGEAQPE
jgi:hypothetical protein